ncbi:MAG: hypothetical protein AAF674_20685 [Pseudomonadota bacterium]
MISQPKRGNAVVAVIPAVLLTSVMAACTPGVQTTSGAAYLAQSQPTAGVPQPAVTRRIVDGKVVETGVQTFSTDELVRHAAAIEPILQLPARIGLARIDNGQLSTIPIAEQKLWQEMGMRHQALGSLTALDPFVASYAMQTILPTDRRALRRDAENLLTKIRVGAARQHLDVVLIYEIGSRGKSVEGMGPLRVLGAAPLSAEVIEREGVARAFLMDVRNGYPYGVASASVDLAGTERDFWDDGPRDRFAVEAKTRVAAALLPKIEAMLSGLTTQMQARLAKGQ